ncbi:MAG: ABC transporter permease [Thermoanaerobaculia bacterium]
MKILHHLKLAWKVLLRRKAFTAVSLFTVAATILVVTTAAALLDEAFGHRSPESRLDRAVGILAMSESGEHSTRTAGAGYGFLDAHMRDLPGVEEQTFFTVPAGVTTYVEGRKVRLLLKRTDAAFWRVFDLRFVEGAPFSDDDERERNFVAVINTATREKLLGDGPAVGRWIEVDGQRFRVAGVVENIPVLRVLPAADVWVPLSTSRTEQYKREFVGSMQAIFVARSAADLPAIRAEIGRRILTTTAPDPERPNLRGGADTKFEAASRILFSDRYESARPGRLRTLLVAFALLFMLLPAVNLTNLNVSRAAERAAEIGVRRAFGAPRRALLGQFLLENVVLALVGGGIGFALAALAIAGINASGLVPYLDLGLSLAVAGWTVLAALVFGILSGLWPAFRLSRMTPVAALTGGAR